MLSIIERARRYVARMDRAVSGQGGHAATFKVAAALVQGFDLSPSDALPLLQEYNETLSEKWTQNELRHKLEDAVRAPSGKPAGYLLQNRSFKRPKRGKKGAKEASKHPRPPRPQKPASFSLVDGYDAWKSKTRREKVHIASEKTRKSDLSVVSVAEIPPTGSIFQIYPSYVSLPVRIRRVERLSTGQFRWAYNYYNSTLTGKEKGQTSVVSVPSVKKGDFGGPEEGGDREGIFRVSVRLSGAQLTKREKEEGKR